MAFRSEPKPDIVAGELIRRTNENVQRIRTVEERLLMVETRLESQEGALIRLETALKKSLDEINEKLHTLSETVARLEVDDAKLKEGLDKVPKRVELEELKSFINMLSPLSSKFITRKEAEELVLSIKAKK